MAAINSARLALRKREAADALAIGLTKLDSLISSGAIHAVRSGKVVLIPRKELEKYLDGLPRTDLSDGPDPLRAKRQGRAKK